MCNTSNALYALVLSTLSTPVTVTYIVFILTSVKMQTNEMTKVDTRMEH